MKNWKTTLGGLIAGLPMIIDAVYDAYTSGAFTGKDGKQIAFAVGIIIIGLYGKDRNVTNVGKNAVTTKELREAGHEV